MWKYYWKSTIQRNDPTVVQEYLDFCYDTQGRNTNDICVLSVFDQIKYLDRNDFNSTEWTFTRDFNRVDLHA